HLFAGTDIGVYASTDGGATWAPFGTGLPATAVFDMQIVQPGTFNESLRVATHGRSMWQVPLSSQPYERPGQAASLQVSLVPAFKQCGTPGNPSNANHAPPLGAASCVLPKPTTTTARTGVSGS